MRKFALLLIALTATVHAELPQAPEYKGDIQRDEHGKLIVVPVPPPERSPPPVPERPSPSARPAPQEAPPRNTQPSAKSEATKPSGTYIDNTAPRCAPQAITCVEIDSTGTTLQSEVPMTFGQPFKAGDLPKGSSLVAKDVTGLVQSQLDETTSHDDGSLRFAVISVQVSNLKPGERRIVNFYRGMPDQGAANRVQASSKPSLQGLNLQATVYSPQISKITFGDRDGGTPGIPFLNNESITLQLGESAEERFTLKITPELAGGYHPTLTKIAYAFMQLINQQSKHYLAYKIGEAGGYEKLWITSIKPDTPAFAVKFIYSGRAKFKLETIQAFKAPQKLEANPAAALDHQLREGRPARLSGPVVREYVVTTPFIDPATGLKHPQLNARIAARFMLKNRLVRADVEIENDWAYQPEPGNISYELNVTQAGKSLLHQDLFTHFHHSRWHQVLWPSREAPQANLRHNMRYVLASRATWNYDLSLKISEQTLAREHANLEKAETGPMQKAMLTHEFGTTGGRPEIGPNPKWTALFLLTQDERAKASMLAIADAATGIPIHYREKSSDQPLNLDDHPSVSFSAKKSASKDAMPVTVNKETPWRPDLSHQGSFAYIPYLITGDLFYQEEIAFWASFNMIAIYPEYRGNGKGLIVREQIRGQAWALRSIGEASRILPDHHPLKNYFKKRLANNLAWYIENYSQPEKTNVSPLGCIVQGDKPTQTAPWQDDFMTIVVGQLAEDGNVQASTYLKSIARCTTDRWMEEDRGYCRQKSAGYWIEIRHRDGRFMRDWPEVFRANWPDIKECRDDKPLDGYPGSPSGYIAYARAALAISGDADIPGATQAYEWLVQKTPELSRAQMGDPTWAIIPRREHTAPKTQKNEGTNH